MKPKSTRVFRTVRSRTVRRFNADNAPEENVMVLKPATNWPDGYVDSFADVPDDFKRAPQGAIENRENFLL